MNRQSSITIERTLYAREDCKIGMVHLGFGAFHRAHQAVYVDDYMDQTGDLNWGIAAVNLRSEEASSFADLASDDDGYLLKTTTSQGVCTFRMVRSHVLERVFVLESQWPLGMFATRSIVRRMRDMASLPRLIT